MKRDIISFKIFIYTRVFIDLCMPDRPTLSFGIKVGKGAAEPIDRDSTGSKHKKESSNE